MAPILESAAIFLELPLLFLVAAPNPATLPFCCNFVVDPLVFFVDLTAAAVAVAGVGWIVVEGILLLFPETSTLFCLSAAILIPAEFVGFLPLFDGDTLSAGTDGAQVT